MFIDAVDECKDRDHVAKVLSCLQKIQKKTKLGVFITDRVAEVAVWRPSFPEASELPIKRAEDADVTWYIRDRLMCSISMRELLWENEQLLGDIVTVISQASHGM